MLKPSFISIRNLCAILVLPLLVLLVAGCSAGSRTTGPDADLADPDATAETRALFTNLRAVAKTGILFGHHDALAYGVHWRGDSARSDVKDVAGSHPALYGWDASRLFQSRNPDVADEEGAARLRQWILEGYGRGGVIEMCWHMRNPVTDGSFYDTTRAVHAIIPGGELHEDFRSKLEVVADFMKSLRADGGELVPVIFRPYHEHTGSWFWWGRNHASVDDFKALWRFTVEYLRDEHEVHNLLYAYSTDVFESEEAYLERYPGDEYIDVLGFDDYQGIRSIDRREDFVRRLRTVVQLAEERGKIPALTETGLEAIPDSTWWTDVLLAGIKSDPVTQRIAWLQVWRNANENHHYAPYPGHGSAENFVLFREDPLILFEDELPEMYESGNRLGD